MQYTGVPQIVGAVVLVPSNTGIFWDVCAFCGGLLFSLYPGWYPRTASPDIPPATESATLPMNANGPPIDAERDDENAVVDGEVMRRDGDIDVAAA